MVFFHLTGLKAGCLWSLNSLSLLCWWWAPTCSWTWHLHVDINVQIPIRPDLTWWYLWSDIRLFCLPSHAVNTQHSGDMLVKFVDECAQPSAGAGCALWPLTDVQAAFRKHCWQRPGHTSIKRSTALDPTAEAPGEDWSLMWDQLRFFFHSV